MTAKAAYWPAAGVASLVLHAGFLVGLALVLRPQVMPPQDMPPLEIELAAHEVERGEAQPEEPPAKPATEAAGEGTTLEQGAIRKTQAQSTALAAERAADVAPRGKSIGAAEIGGAPLPSYQPEIAAAKLATGPQNKVNAEPAVSAATLTATDAPAVAAVAQQPVAGSLAAIAAFGNQVIASNSPAPTTLVETALKSSDLASQPVETTSGSQLKIEGAVVGQLDQSTTAAASHAPEHQRTTPQEIAAGPGQEFAPDPVQPAEQSPVQFASAAGALSPPSTHATAALAWSGGDDSTVDPVSLAAIQSFMQPQDLAGSIDGSPVRDGIEAMLAALPCSRLQTVFLPETGTLQLRGHLPDDDMRAPLLAAIQSQVGDSIPVADALLILPRPQCGALSGIAGVGLAQSNDQTTNPKVVGEDAFVREFRYSEGERLELELTAPDYEAYIYIDYFDADGMVLHLQPNEIVPLERATAKSAQTSGVNRDGRPALNLTIGPPYGQEIAVAFAASTRLYDGLRPITEPAEPYLEFLRERVSQAREANADFKGEWVYFFISTRPAN